MGQDSEFKATAPASVQVGQQFQYMIEGNDQGSVTLPGNDAFQVLSGPFSSISTQSQWINGKMTMNTVVSYTYIFKATRMGQFTLDPSTVKVGRKEYKTNEVAVNVVDAGTASQGAGAQQPGAGGNAAAGNQPDEIFMRVIPSKTDVYLGEQFVSGLKVFTRVRTRPASSGKDFPYEGFYKKSLDPDQSAQQEKINGVDYVSQVIQRHILIPQKTGKITIQPYETDWVVQQRVQRQRTNSAFDDFFNDPFFNDPFNSYREVPVTISTKPVTINVKPLPPGAPKGFTGAVGSFRVDASISDDNLDVNDALSLKIVITGTGNLPLIGEPEVSLPPDHDVYDVNKSSNISTAGNRLSGSITFEYPIVARHAGKFRITPINFTWFDPQKVRYETVTTPEFRFTVNKGEAEDQIGQIYVPGAMGEAVENIGTDIRDVIRGPAGLIPAYTTLFGKSWYWLAYTAILALFIATFILLRIIIKRNADLVLVRNRKASKMAHGRLKKADRFRKEGEQDRFFEETGKAIWEYLRDKLGIEISELSLDLVRSTLKDKGVNEELIGELQRIVEESEFSRFAPTSEKSNMDDIYRDSVSLIRNLEQNI